jgi:PAS domain S-box-containing protein
MTQDLRSEIRVPDVIMAEAFANIGKPRALETKVAAQRALLDLAHDAIMVRDAEQRLTYWNQGAERTFGWAREEALGRRSYELLRTEFPAPVEDIETTLVRDGYWEGELVQTARDGRKVTVASRWVASYDADGAVSAVMAINTDITEQKVAEERANVQTVLLDLARDAIIVRDTDHRITYWNQGAERTFGWAREEALGRRSYELLGTEFPAPVEQIEKALVRDGHWVGELVQTARDGRRLTVASRWVASYDVAGGISNVMVINTDITDRKAAEERVAEQTHELQRVNIELGRSNDELEQFAYAASHDLSEPLRAISGPVSLLARRYRGQLDPEADALIDFAVDGCARLQTLITDLLAYSSVSRLDPQRVEIDLNTLVSSVLLAYRPLIEERGAVVTVDHLPKVRAVPTQLGRVFQNLISNAIKFTPPEITPQIRITAVNDDWGWRFSVTDNGIGIDPRHRDRIFKMFKRLHSREAYPGTGIGLALCKKIVEYHGGTIGVEDGAGGTGCTFCFTLPTKEDHRQ